MFLDVEWDPSPAKLRRWSFITASVLGCIAALEQTFWTASPRTTVAWVLGGVFVVAGIVGPAASRPLHRAWMTFGWVVATVVGTMTLALVYFLVITPIGVACRIAGRDLLHLRRTSSSSLWRTVRAQIDDPRRQF